MTIIIVLDIDEDTAVTAYTSDDNYDNHNYSSCTYNSNHK